MATPQWLGAIAALAIAPSLVQPAEAAVYRIQTRPLPPLADLSVQAPDLSPRSPLIDTPRWLEWALRLMDGRAFTFAQPSWQGQNWWVGMEAGLKGQLNLGFGPALLVNGRLFGRSWSLEGQTMALASAGGVSWLAEATLGRAPWTLGLRAWNGPGSSSVGQSATLSLRQGF